MADRTGTAPISAGQYALIRMLLGGYLIVHFIHLLPYGAELFSSAGLLPAELSPLLGIIPNPLTSYDSPGVVLVILAVGAVSGLLIAVGAFDRIAAGIAALVLAWLFARNPLIANPSLPVVGWMLVAHMFTPTGGYGAWSSRGQPERWLEWRYPWPIWMSAWLMLAVAYSYSGYTKMLSPSWMDGTAIQLVLENPLARDHWVRTLFLALPPIVLKILTWFVMIIELVFVPLCAHRTTRQWAWIAMLFVQLGFLVFLNFADLTFPMLLIHALTFDPRWVGSRRQIDKGILFFDGDCAFCNGFVRFLLAQDDGRRLEYSPLAGETFAARGMEAAAGDSIILVADNDRARYKSDAVIAAFRLLGGPWALIAAALSLIPKTIRDLAYDAVGAIRYRLGGTASAACRRLPPEYGQRLLN